VRRGIRRADLLSDQWSGGIHHHYTKRGASPSTVYLKVCRQRHAHAYYACLPRATSVVRWELLPHSFLDPALPSSMFFAYIPHLLLSLCRLLYNLKRGYVTDTYHIYHMPCCCYPDYYLIVDSVLFYLVIHIVLPNILCSSSIVNSKLYPDSSVTLRYRKSGRS
jgi:hypothetical protein